MAKNEFEDLDSEEMAPSATVSETHIQNNNEENMIAAGSAGTVYDWQKAPQGTKSAPRKDLSGQIVTITKADIILPPTSRPWELTKAGDKQFKYCSFTLGYNNEGQSENYSGVRVFKKEENGIDKYSHPTATRDRKNQASKLLGLYADYKKKDINEISLHEFLSFLHTQPKAKIMKMSVTNPETGAIIEKNIIQEFVNP